MPLIVETGDGADPTANSYVSRTELIAFAALRGVPLLDEDATDILAIKGMDYLAIQPWKGVPTSAAQPLDWPRTGVEVNCALVGSAEIPSKVKTAQMMLALHANAGIVLVPTIEAGPQRVIISKKLGPIETQWSDNIATASASRETPSLPDVENALAPYLKIAGPTRSYRV